MSGRACAGSRTVADGTLSPAAGRRSGLASRAGPQASTRTSPRQVKSAPPQAEMGLTPGPEPRVDTARCPPRANKGTAPGTGRPWAGHREGGTVACAREARATVAPASYTVREPDEGVPTCRQRAALSEGSIMGRVGPACRHFVRYYRNRVFGAVLHALREIGSSEMRKPAATVGVRRRCRCYRVLVGLSQLAVGRLAIILVSQVTALASSQETEDM
jgi:hypothetical protein